MYTLIAKFLGPKWGPSGADRTQVGPMLVPGTLLSEYIKSAVPEAGIEAGTSNYIPQILWPFVGCNYLSLPLKPAFSTTFLICNMRPLYDWPRASEATVRNSGQLIKRIQLQLITNDIITNIEHIRGIYFRYTWSQISRQWISLLHQLFCCRKMGILGAMQPVL